MIVVERRIPADRQTVWSCVSDLDRWADLLPTVDEVQRVGPPGPITVGTQFELHQPGLRPATYTVTDWRPGAGFTWEAHNRGLTTTATHTLTTAGGETVLRLGISWEGRGVGLVKMLFGRKTRRYMEAEAEAFADHSSARTA